MPAARIRATLEPSQKDVFGQQLDQAQVLTFKTTNAQPTISMDSGYFVAELKRPVLPVWARNVNELQVRIVDITQANFHQVRPHLDWWDDKPADLKKTRLTAVEKKVKVAGVKNKWGQVAVDPATLLGRTPGPGLYYVEVGSSEVAKATYRLDSPAWIELPASGTPRSNVSDPGASRIR